MGDQARPSSGRRPATTSSSTARCASVTARSAAAWSVPETPAARTCRRASRASPTACAATRPATARSRSPSGTVAATTRASSTTERRDPGPSSDMSCCPRAPAPALRPPPGPRARHGAVLLLAAVRRGPPGRCGSWSDARAHTLSTASRTMPTSRRCCAASTRTRSMWATVRCRGRPSVRAIHTTVSWPGSGPPPP
ncbi:Uncharacterised protein [Mycobacteroides abscessus]|nr:Uncharacterised protein [Mycobacteroides abscessus]